MEQINYTQVPAMCSGIVVKKIDRGEATYEVQIYKSPIGDFNGPIYCTSVYSPSTDNRYVPGDKVKVLITFMFGGPNEKFEDMASGTEAYVMGKFDDEAIIDFEIENPLLPDDDKGVRFFNRVSKSGMSITDKGHIAITSGGPVVDYLAPGGGGKDRHARYSYAQNFHKVVGGVNSFETAREHFGMNDGVDGDDRSSRMTADQNEVVYRRFVPKNSNISDWVSTCEGSFSPFMGMNNKTGEVKASRETLFYKVINKDTKRITIRGGEPGESFFSLRVDDVVKGEQSVPVETGAVTGSLGGLFSFDITDDGGFSIKAGKGGTPGAVDSNIVIEGTAEGELSIRASKGITLTTGTADEALNSITIGESAVKINSADSMQVNGLNLLTETFIDWLDKARAVMFGPTPPGSVPPPGPGWNALLESVKQTPGVLTTTGIPVPVSGANPSEDTIITT